MQVKVSQMGGAVYLTPDAALLEENLAELKRAASEARSVGASNLVVDLRDVPFVDSRGLELLLDLATELRSEAGSLRLANLSRACQDVLAMTRLDEVIPVFENLESVGRSFL